MVDSAVRNAALLSDGCNPELVKGAEFDGIFEFVIKDAEGLAKITVNGTICIPRDMKVDTVITLLQGN